MASQNKAKVTIVIEDIDAQDGESSVSISGDFDQPGKSYEEMITDPTMAVSMGLGLIAAAMQESSRFKGNMVDEFGNTMDFLKPTHNDPT